MSIDIDKNKTHILQVYNYVLDDKSPTDWALFGYEGQTNVLKVVGYGDDGLEELAEELNASKIMYGVIRIQDPKTSRTKIILLNWQGEGAPNLRKGICSRHLSDVKRMLKGVHITLSARTEDDVETEAILDALSKATSTEYNFKDRSEIPDKNVPVGTNYKRTNPQSEIDANRRNKFWEEQEAEEKVRKEEEIKKREAEAKRLERERLDREIRDSKHREEVNKERNARIFADKKAEMSAIENTRKLTGSPIWKKEDENQKREEEEVERARRADMMRMERKKEAESLIGHKTHHARSVFETQWSQTSSKNDSTQAASKAPSRKLLKEFNPNNTDVSLSTQRENSVPKKSVGTRWPPPSDENVPEQRKTVPGKITEWKPERVKEVTEPENHQINSFQEQASSGVELSFKGRSSFLHQNNTSQQHTTKDSDVLEHTQPYQGRAQATSPSTHHHQSYTHVTTPVTTPVTISATSPVSVAFPSSPVETSPPAAFSDSPQISPHSGGDKSNSSSYAPASPQSGGERNHGSPYAPASPHFGGCLPSETSGERGHSSPSYDKFSSSNADPKIKEADSYRTNGGLSHYEDEEDVPYTTEEHDEFGPVSMTYEVDGIEYQILPEHGICARALYDYQAADDTEITFDPGDIITNIDQIDVGWWQGVSPMGVFGLFPANYVELINGNKIH